MQEEIKKTILKQLCPNNTTMQNILLLETKPNKEFWDKICKANIGDLLISITEADKDGLANISGIKEILNKK